MTEAKQEVFWQEQYEGYTPYRKKAKKRKPKKANHKHEFEPVILKYYNKQLTFSRANGFVGGIDYNRGSRCKVCGLLRHGFPGQDTRFLCYPILHLSTGRELLEEYPDLPVVEINDYWHLND